MTAQNRKIYIFENSQAMTDYLLQKWQKLGEEALYKRNRFNVALSGGRTPGEFYTKLSSLDNLDLWQKTHIFWADERFVPPSDKRSNFRMVKEALLNYVSVPSSNIHAVPTDVENAAVAAEHYKNFLVSFFSRAHDTLPCFDFVLLGIGDDGHTASLFPGMTDIDNPKRVTIPVGLNYLTEDRVSLSLSVINRAPCIISLATGRKKAEIIKSIVEDSADLPAAKVFSESGETIMLLDRDAASKLRDPGQYLYRGEEMLE